MTPRSSACTSGCSRLSAPIWPAVLSRISRSISVLRPRATDGPTLAFPPSQFSASLSFPVNHLVCRSCRFGLFAVLARSTAVPGFQDIRLKDGKLLRRFRDCDVETILPFSNLILRVQRGTSAMEPSDSVPPL